MTLVSDIIQRGYRESNIIGIGVTPTAAEQAEALPLVQEIVLSVFGNQAGEPFRPLMIGGNNIQAPLGWPSWTPPETWWAPINTRLICNITSQLMINLTPTPQDGSRMAVIDASGNFSSNPLMLVGNGHSIENAHSITLDEDSTKKEWFFRSDLDNWQLVTPLDATDEMPFPQEFDSLFSIILATRLNPRSGKDVAIPTQASLKHLQEQFRARYHQTIATPADPGVLRMSRQTHSRFGRRFGGGLTSFLSGGWW